MEQILNIWKGFRKNNVKYITIGGFAVNIYGYNRNTGDLDILIAAAAIVRDATLVTQNIKHFQKIPGLQVVSL